MKVTAWKTIEVECEFEVDSDAIVNEFSERVDESSSDYYVSMLSAMDVITRAMARIDDATITAMALVARLEIAQRLDAQAKRWTKG